VIAGLKAELEGDKASELKRRLFNGESFLQWSDTFNVNEPLLVTFGNTELT
jgi:hypothetical protein